MVDQLYGDQVNIVERSLESNWQALIQDADVEGARISTHEGS